MKLLNIMAAVTVALMVILGCKTVNGKKTLDADRVALVLGQAAQLGTTYYLRAHPADVARFRLAEQSLTRLIDAENYDPVAFADALKTLPVDELSGPNGSLYVSAAIVVWDQVAQTAESVTKKELVKKSLTAVRNGIRSALGTTPPLPPSGVTPK